MHEGVDTNMSSSKKIYMILTNGFDPDVRVYKEAKYLVTEGFNVEIICWDRKCEYVDRNEEVIDGINIKRFCIPSKPGTGMKQIIPYIKFIIIISAINTVCINEEDIILTSGMTLTRKSTFLSR